MNLRDNLPMIFPSVSSVRTFVIREAGDIFKFSKEDSSDLLLTIIVIPPMLTHAVENNIPARMAIHQSGDCVILEDDSKENVAQLEPKSMGELWLGYRRNYPAPVATNYNDWPEIETLRRLLIGERRRPGEYGEYFHHPEEVDE